MNRTLFPGRLAIILLLGLALSACSPDTPEASPGDHSTAAEPAAAGTAAEPVRADVPEVIVLVGMDGLMERLKQENWWGEENRDEQLTVPHLMIARIHPAWREVAPNLPVPQKKEIFYRLMLPLVMHANEMVMDRRGKLLEARNRLEAGKALTTEELEAFKRAALLLRVRSEEEIAALAADSPDLTAILDDMLYRLDVVPAGLALGQAAYESGYGTSRFAVEGNALFGQWTFGGEGLTPEQQRKELGDHRIASFEWPFDSVRGYFINLSAHPATGKQAKARYHKGMAVFVRTKGGLMYEASIGGQKFSFKPKE